MAAMLLCGVATNSFAAEEDFNLIDYVEDTKINSYSEFLSVLDDNNCGSGVSMSTYSLRYLSDQEEYFSVEIDYENSTVEVDVVYDLTNSNVASTRASTRSGVAVHETYSDAGVLIYTVTVNGTFTYTSNTCTITSKSGTFVKGRFSFWSSTPTISSGYFSATQAYARIAGTAMMLTQSSSYCLILMCNTSGSLSSTFTRS
jgi:hypothetical protein